MLSYNFDDLYCNENNYDEYYYYLYFDDEEFSNLSYQNINELYEFKKILQDKKIIIPILKESKLSKKFVSFTPINPSDLISLDGLLPPKSTWITPRL